MEIMRHQNSWREMRSRKPSSRSRRLCLCVNLRWFSIKKRYYHLSWSDDRRSGHCAAVVTALPVNGITASQLLICFTSNRVKTRQQGSANCCDQNHLPSVVWRELIVAHRCWALTQSGALIRCHPLHPVLASFHVILWQTFNCAQKRGCKITQICMTQLVFAIWDFVFLLINWFLCKFNTFSDSVKALTIFLLTSALQSQWGYFFLFLWANCSLQQPDLSYLFFNQCFLFTCSFFLELSVRWRVAICQVPGSVWASGSCQLRGRRAVELLQRALGEAGRLGTSADGHRWAAHQQWLWVRPLSARCQLR